MEYKKSALSFRSQLRGLTENGFENISAFPPGLVMAAGSPLRREFMGDAMADAIIFECPDHPERPACHQLPMNCTSILAKVHFPSCWNGKDLTSKKFTHMAYPEDGYISGKCPGTHPVRVIGLSYEFGFETAYDGSAGNSSLVFSMGDVTGHGFHGIFINGWNTEDLQKAIDTCDDSITGDIATTCPVLSQWTLEQNQDCKVPPRVNESITGVGQLPGCNAVGAPVDPHVCGNHKSIDDFELFYQDLTSHQWSYAGCSSCLNPLSTNLSQTWTWTQDNMTPEVCMIDCMSSFPSGADMDNSWFSITGNTCHCALNGPFEGTAPVLGYLGNCDLPCDGDESFRCGGENSSSLYRYCPINSTCSNYEFEQYIYKLTSIDHSKRTQVANSVVETMPKNATFLQNAPPVRDVRPESPHEHSIFIGYKVCARSYVDVEEPAKNLSCYVFEGYRAEGVAAAFIDWAVSEYGLNEWDTYVSPEDTIDARIAMRLSVLRDMRPKAMAIDFMVSGLLLVSVFIITIGIISLQVAKCKVSRAQKKELKLENDMQVIQHILNMDQASRDQLFAKHEQIKQHMARQQEMQSYYSIPMGHPC